MRSVFGLLLLTVWACADDGPYIPDGKLGFPLGSYLTIEGVRAKEGEGQKGGTARVLVVDTVNGKKLEQPISTVVETNGHLPLDVRIVVRGYETGKMVGVPFEVARQEKRISMSQAGWQFYRSFIITSWVTPEGPTQAPVRAAPRTAPPPPPGVEAPPPPAADQSLEERLEKIRERRRQLLQERDAAAAAAKAAAEAAKEAAAEE